MDRGTAVGDPTTYEIGKSGGGEERVTKGVDTHHLQAARVNSASIVTQPTAAVASFVDTLPINQPFLKLKAPFYKLTKVIGQGSFATVYLATHQLTGLKVAVKVYCRRQVLEKNGDLQRVWEEARIMWALSGHPHIVQIYECVETQDCVYIVMEYVPNGDLDFYGMGAGPRPPEHEARRVFQQIISAIEYCHLQGVSHHDIKAENILIDAHNNVRVADFGLSCDIRRGDSLTRSCGTRQYAAPELFFPRNSRAHSGRAADVWSCGVILYALLCGRLPFEDHLTWRIQRADYESPTHLSADALDLLNRMLTVNPMERISIPAIRQHRFFQPCLPPYIANPADTYQLTQIDVQSLISVVRLGCGANYLLSSLWQLARDQRSNQATVAYFALVHAKKSLPGQNRLDKLTGQLVGANQGDVQAVLHVPSGALNFASPGADARWTIPLQGPSTLIKAALETILNEMGVTWLKEGDCFYHYPLYRTADTCTSPSSLAFLQIRTSTRSTLQLRFTIVLSKVLGTEVQSSDVPLECYLPVRGFEMTNCSSGDERCILDLQKRDGSLALFHDTCGTLLANLLVL